jgi:hypothetical protein
MKDWKDILDNAAIFPRLLEIDPHIPPLGNGKIPGIDQLTKPDALPPPLWNPSVPIPPIVPVPKDNDPFGPVPVPPIDVDPPSRPPEWMFGPPEIARASPPVPRFPLEALLSADPGRALSEWASSSQRRPAASSPTPPATARRAADFLMDYIRNQKLRSQT